MSRGFQVCFILSPRRTLCDGLLERGGQNDPVNWKRKWWFRLLAAPQVQGRPSWTGFNNFGHFGFVQIMVYPPESFPMNDSYWLMRWLAGTTIYRPICVDGSVCPERLWLVVNWWKILRHLRCRTASLNIFSRAIRASSCLWLSLLWFAVPTIPPFHCNILQPQGYWLVLLNMHSFPY